MGKYLDKDIKKKVGKRYALYDGKTPLLSVSTHSSRPTKVIEEKKSSKQEIVEDVMRQISRRMNYFGGGGSTRMDGFATALAASSGSSLVGTIAAGTGAVARTQQDKNRKDIAISPEDYGAVGNGVTDDGTALTNFFNDLLANTNLEGRMLSKIYASSVSLPTINVSGFTLRGFGPAGSHDTGSLDVGSVIKAIAGNTGTMLTVAPTEGAGAQSLSGIRLLGITLNANNIAARGLITKSMRYFEFDLAILNAVTTGWEMGVSSILGEAADTFRGRIRYYGRQLEAAAGVSLRLKGSATANCSFNTFELIDISHKDVPAIIEENADNNTWKDVRTNMAGGGAASASIEWQGGASSDVACRSERFKKLSANKAAIAKGTGTYTAGAQNIRMLLDKSNNTPDPTVETGATAYWQNDSTPVYDGVWHTYVPTVTSGAGTITTLGTITGRYMYLAPNLIKVEIGIAITTNGTGSSFIRATLPFVSGTAAQQAIYVFAGLETATGNMLVGRVGKNSSNLDIQFYNASYPGANGNNLQITGDYATS